MELLVNWIGKRAIRFASCLEQRSDPVSSGYSCHVIKNVPERLVMIT